MSRLRWSGCWNPHSCNSRSVRAWVPATEIRKRRFVPSRSAGADPTRLLARQFVSQQLGEGEGARRPVVLAEQVQPLDGGEDAFSDRVTGRGVHKHATVGGGGWVWSRHR